MQVQQNNGPKQKYKAYNSNGLVWKLTFAKLNREIRDSHIKVDSHINKAPN